MRRFLISGCCCLLALRASAQPGIDEMQQAQQQLASSFFSAMDFALVLAGLFGIIGAVRIYHNWQLGHPRIDEAVAAWFFAAVFMVMAGAFLRAVFGI
ncbi:DUF4134 family protein [Mucilaginibacter gotjawali]|uniref:Uncharacterized protein n=2 Tax=Mucilaginibacter gotjawali TaxID=1550579 RepID=A0A839SIU0_9SPHI|nr:DUF4134 family protein [Mucilaginibacter gotjawali]MBB3058251.1 hypothetical protein [Mucilaginibacter gotjawali]BAU55630.1 hypothetical protein MgSA37_03821 [Mucilaginibacter gotjawali]